MSQNKFKSPAATNLELFIRGLVIKWENISSREVYPWTLPFLKNFERCDFVKPVTIFVGENGSGKSTLLEGIAEACGINSEGGSRNHNFSTTNHSSPIANYIRLIRNPIRPQTDFFLRAESMYNVITEYEKMGSDGGSFADLHYCSHGEGFLEIVLKRFGRNGLYLMDEPEAALSPQNQLTLIYRMAQLVASNSQFILATHSPILMAFPDAQLIRFSEDGIEPVEFIETEHYQITRRVLDDPVNYMKKLLEEE